MAFMTLKTQKMIYVGMKSGTQIALELNQFVTSDLLAILISVIKSNKV